jgi:hypothetical protein
MLNGVFMRLVYPVRQLMNNGRYCNGHRKLYTHTSMSLCISIWKGKAIPVIGRGGRRVVRRRGAHIILDSRLTDCCEVSVTRPWKCLLKRLSRPEGHSAAGRIRRIEKSSDLIGNRNQNLSSCGIVPQPTTLPRAPRPSFLCQQNVVFPSGHPSKY